MITLSRSQVVGAEILSEDRVRFTAIQEDHIYGMEVEMDVQGSTGEILTIKGLMKRYTTPICPQAVDVLQEAVGMRLRGKTWEYDIMRRIGRKGCQHFAEIMIECGRCLDPVRMSSALEEALKQDAGLDQNAFLQEWLASHPEARHGCLATS